MSINILMPALSPTMTEGTLSRWLKREGDTIVAGDVIAEIETDKATMEVEAVDEGVLAEIVVADGTAHVAVNATIAILALPGETKASSTEVIAAVPTVPAAGVAPAAMAAPLPAPPDGHDAAPRIAASPLARRIAQQTGIDLSAIRGSGPNGRIVRADLQPISAPASAEVAPAPAPRPVAPAEPAPITAPHRLVRHSSVRKIIARRLTESKQTVPHFYLSMDVTLDALLRLRTDINARSRPEGPAPFKLSVNDLIIKAAALALRQVPGVNASYTEAGIMLFDEVDISVAVAIRDGLITPIIRSADLKSPIAISAEMKDLAARAKLGKLKPEEYQGGGFSISNLGMFGISSFAAVINPPQGAILAVGAGEQRAVVNAGALAIATVMTCTLSADHRVIDGALGASWLQAFKAIVEDPLGLLL